MEIGAWVSITSDERKSMVFKRKTVQRIFVPMRNEEDDYEMRSNRKLNMLFNDPNVVNIFKSRKVREAGHVLDSRESNHRYCYEMEIK